MNMPDVEKVLFVVDRNDLEPRKPHVTLMLLKLRVWIAQTAHAYFGQATRSTPRQADCDHYSKVK